MNIISEHSTEVADGKRFEFGENWKRFLRSLNETRIDAAVNSLRTMLGTETLQHLTFLDIGSGSGLSSLAAYKLGAEVRSFDYDPHSVNCTRELHERFSVPARRWHVETGSILDKEYLRTLGKFDIVYSWGVLHHTGSMWESLSNVVDLVGDNGKLFIAIYNDQGEQSKRWLRIKQIYNFLPSSLAGIFGLFVLIPIELKYFLGDLLKLRPMFYVKRWTNYAGASYRGMSKYRDFVDWVGGLPFEVARPEEIILFYQARGFKLINVKTCGGGTGCNEFVFQRT